MPSTTRIALIALVVLVAPAVADATVKRFDIVAQPAGSALNEFAKQADVTLVYSYEDVAGERANAVRGEFPIFDALGRLLYGSALHYRQLGDDTIAVNTRGGQFASNGNMAVGPGPTPGDALVQALQETGSASGTSRRVPQPEDTGFGPETSTTIEEIIVTGSNIRGANRVSPVSTYTAEEIERSGYATVQQFLQTLPENFGGGQSVQAINISGAVTFTPLGSGVNLRGLGNAATLVLLNGHRLAPAGFGNFVDVGMIPTSAIDRVEVLTDGASAIYGSDAVGGVVNFVLRDDYEGAETRVRYGTVTDGQSAEYQLSQTLGHRWDAGSVLAGYEFYEREPLSTDDRAATRIAPDPSDVFPGDRRHSLLLNFTQQIGTHLEFIAGGQLGEREGNYRTIDLLGQRRDSDYSQSQRGARLGLTADLHSDWLGEVFASYYRNENEVFTRIASVDPASVPATFSDVASLDLKADGPVLDLPGGAMKVAIGGQFRREALDFEYRGVTMDRDVRSVFGELNIPLVGSANEVRGVRRLTATAAVRYDHYSDFGSTTNPKFGVRWSPVKGLNVRGTYGTSFRSPLLFDLAEVADQTVATPLVDVGGSPTLAILRIGSNPALQPESARTWTAGIDLQPDWAPGLTATLTYYDIDYDDRVLALAKDPRGFLALQFESIFAPVITRDPLPDEVAALVARPRFFNFSPTPTADLPDTVGAIVDLRQRNLGGTNTRGLDLGVKYSFARGDNSFGLVFNGTYIAELSQQLTSVAPWDEKVDTILNPSDLKIKTGLSWTRGGASTGIFVNYTGAYTNNLVMPEQQIDSWTTMDINFRYAFSGSGGAFDGLAVTLNVVNLLDEAPPFVIAAGPIAMNYDPSNAQILGRFVALQIGKEW